MITKTGRKLRMRQALAFLSCLLASVPMVALANDPCSDLWLSRNAMLNDAGYCFSSNLGQTIFDNADCSTDEPVLLADVQQQIGAIATQEKLSQCVVDTSSRSINLDHIYLRLQLDFQPLDEGDEGGCLGYQGNPITVYSAPNPSSKILGTIQPNDSFAMRYPDWEGWSFSGEISIGTGIDPETRPFMGWYNVEIGLNSCKMHVG